MSLLTNSLSFFSFSFFLSLTLSLFLFLSTLSFSLSTLSFSLSLSLSLFDSLPYLFTACAEVSSPILKASTLNFAYRKPWNHGSPSSGCVLGLSIFSIILPAGVDKSKRIGLWVVYIRIYLCAQESRKKKNLLGWKGGKGLEIKKNSRWLRKKKCVPKTHVVMVFLIDISFINFVYLILNIPQKVP